MQAVGRIGSYISKSVYTVSGPFHPFGGAVDIIVVEQPDGSYKSSPWYVRFGKFQGVLKSKEKVVKISVNGVDADFHMYLDHKGEAFFLTEVDEGIESATSPPYSSGDDMESRRPLKSISCNFDSKWSESISSDRKVIARANSRRSQIFGYVFGRRSLSEEGFQVKGDASDVVRTESMELAEFTADLLDIKWSTNLDSPRAKSTIDNVSLLSSSETLKDGVDKKTPVDGSTSEYVIKTTTSVESVREDANLLNSEPLMIDTGKPDVHVNSVSIVSEVAKSDSQSLGNQDQFSFVHEEKTFDASERIVTKCYSQLVCVHQPNDSLKDIDSQSVPVASSSIYTTCSPKDEQNGLGQKDEHESSEGSLCVCNSIPPCTQELRVAEEEVLLFGELDGLGSNCAKNVEVSHTDHVGNETDGKGANESSNVKLGSSFSLDQSIINDYLNDDNIQRTRLCSVSSDACIIESEHEEPRVLTRMASSLPIIGSFDDTFEASESSGTDKNHQLSGAQTRESKEGPAYQSIGSRSNVPCPFKRTMGRKVSNVDMNGSENSNDGEIFYNAIDSERGTEEVTKVKVIKQKVRTLAPTSEQLASLKLKEGKNTIIFTFSTSMLGQQQVDARIFLWRWDTRIVISDVDGTITRSDLLGQVMPLVGMDWSQTGVAHLFTAIKENGYQLIFLSARSISQSFITRQFLLGIKQDGKALPEGPVVISPDGLFPSLFREVVRRAPHEFKIACLEEIKALFPPDCNPFYAGFGNRDTDEVSYLKVGIPMGKIFIINPKGEIAVNRRVDTKSYLSLHDLVHTMFPTMSTSEQEDYNSWNFWKLPPPAVDI
ncbi:hypothetical protein ACS0TY_013338 [Phlomoides rotata]